MKKILLLVFFLSGFLSYAQEDAWVYFNDKPNAQVFFNDPLSVLTQRALDRRTAQNIALDITDVPVEQSYIDEITASSGIIVMARSKWLNCLHIRGSIANIQALANLPFVNHIRFANNSLNNKTGIAQPFQPVNKQLDAQAVFAYGNSGNQIQMLNANTLHQANYTGNGKIIAVLDSGFSAVNTIIPFNRMFDHNLYLGGYNYVAGNDDVFSTHNHGTMTLSCMVGYVEGQLVGTAPDAQYYLFITEDAFNENPVEESYWVEAAEEADRLGADVISTSLGYAAYDNPNYSHSYEDLDGNTAFASQGANMAFSKGIVVVAAAGNSGGTANPYINVPGEATNVLGVGAVKADRSYAAFSSIGPSFDGRVKPDVMAQGQNATVSDINGTVTTANGTSFACPILAGAITCFWQAVPWATNTQVIDFVKHSADRFANPTDQYGYGIPDFQLALDAALLSVNDTSKERFLVYPNPAHNVLVFSFPNNFEQAKVSLYNALGQLVLKESVQKTNEAVSLENLQPGIYFYKLESQSFAQSGKIIKN